MNWKIKHTDFEKQLLILRYEMIDEADKWRIKEVNSDYYRDFLQQVVKRYGENR
mgnify:CR=1 FL=1